MEYTDLPDLLIEAHEYLDTRASIHQRNVRIDIQIIEMEPGVLYDLEPSPSDPEEPI